MVSVLVPLVAVVAVLALFAPAYLRAVLRRLRGQG